MYALLPPACVVSDLVRGVAEHGLYGAVPALLAGSEVVVPDRLVGSFGDQAVAFLALFERLLGFLSLCDVYGDGDRAGDLAGPRPHRRIPHLERPTISPGSSPSAPIPLPSESVTTPAKSRAKSTTGTLEMTVRSLSSLSLSASSARLRSVMSYWMPSQ